MLGRILMRQHNTNHPTWLIKEWEIWFHRKDVETKKREEEQTHKGI